MGAVVGLRWSGDVGTAVVGEVTGHAELAVVGVGSESAIALVDAVLAPSAGAGSAAPGTARSLAVADRDRILVRIHLDLYGAQIATTQTCRACGERFDLDFRLDDLAAHCEPDVGEPDPSADARWRLGDLEFRPLTGDDELAVLGDRDPARALFRRVTEGATLEDPGPGTRADVAEALALLAPPVATTIAAACPECGAAQPVEFDVQRFLLARLLAERPLLWRTVHRIAAAYHWSRDEILGLGRAEREAYAEVILAGSRARAR